MRKPVSRSRQIRYWFEWALVRVAFWLFRAIGRRRSLALGSWIGRKIGPKLSAHKTAVENIRLALPELDQLEQVGVVDRMWSNLGASAAELPFVGDENDASVEVVGKEHLDAYVKSGKPGIFVTAHFGPWEQTSLASYYIKKKPCVVYRPANNPMVEAFFQKERAGSGYNFVPKGKSGARAILKTLKENGSVVLLNDQKQNNGLPIPFFGRDAMTATAIADFACRQDLAVYPLRAERLEDGKTRLTVYAPMYAETSDDRQKDVIQFLTRINVMYESWIRERPDHWFWVHNRWS
ncbi:MAG: lysophospholipid acyltransferase family protein [Sneathiella sp.]